MPIGKKAERTALEGGVMTFLPAPLVRALINGPGLHIDGHPLFLPGSGRPQRVRITRSRRASSVHQQRNPS